MRISRRSIAVMAVVVFLLAFVFVLEAQRDDMQEVRFSIMSDTETLIIELPAWADPADLRDDLQTLPGLAEVRIDGRAVSLKRTANNRISRMMLEVLGVLVKRGHIRADAANIIITDVERRFGPSTQSPSGGGS